MDQNLTNTIIVGACGLAWLIALVVGVWRVRQRSDRRGLIRAALILAGLVAVLALYLGTETGAKLSARLHAAFTGPPATLVTSWQGPGDLEYRLGPRELVSHSTDGRHIVEAGTLRLSSFTARAGSGETRWEARTSLYELPPLTVAAGQEQPLKVGPPYTARIEYEAQLNRLALKITDVGGHSANIGDAEQTSPPQFEVRNQQGKVVWQGKFAYG